MIRPRPPTSTLVGTSRACRLRFCSLPAAAAPRIVRPRPARAYLRIVDGDALLDRDDDTRHRPTPACRSCLAIASARAAAASKFSSPTARRSMSTSSPTVEPAGAAGTASGRGPRRADYSRRANRDAAVSRSTRRPRRPTATAPASTALRVLGQPRRPQTELAVMRGRAATASADRGSVQLQRWRAQHRRAERRALASGVVQRCALRRVRSTGRCAQRDDRVGRTIRAVTCPPDLRVYGGTLDRNGNWQYESSYGYVWYPTVAVGWHPYYSGYWATVPAYGWTWIGAERGRGRRITTAAGAMRTTGGSGFRNGTGRRRGCRGVPRPGT